MTQKQEVPISPVLWREADLAPLPQAGARRRLMQPEVSAPGRKRVFVGLVVGTSFLLCGILLVGWFIPYIGLGNIHPYIPYVTGGVLILLMFIVLWASAGTIVALLSGRPVRSSGKIRGSLSKIFLPCMEVVGRLVRIPPQEVRRSFILVNNELVLGAEGRFKPAELLILLPHCIQWSGCQIRINTDMNRCKRCGHCAVSALLALGETYGVHLAIATGGTIARRIVVEKRPRLIVAVACERDLTSGIQDTFPLPVYGILNERPHGPCCDTEVALPRVEAALRRFITPEFLPAQPLTFGVGERQTAPGAS